MYTCQGQCRMPISTVNLTDGTTPFMSLCPRCGGPVQSQMYMVMEFLHKNRIANIQITHCWYRPTFEEFMTLDPDTKRHVLHGGLLKCEFPPSRATLLEQPPEDYLAWLNEIYKVVVLDGDN